MADFAHLMDTMSRVRGGGVPPPERIIDPNAMPNLNDRPYFVGKTSQAVIEKVMVTAPAGDFVVRESERVPNSLVLMLKTSPTAGMQRRITFRDGQFTMDVGGTKCTHESLDRLLQLETQCRRPVGHKVQAAFSNASSRHDSRSSQSSNSTVVGPTAVPAQSSREILEAAMTAAERGEFDRAMQLADQAKALGASHRNLSKAIGYIQSIAPPGTIGPLASRRTSSTEGTQFQVVVLGGPDATRLELGGQAVCTVSSDCTLTLRPTGATSARAEARWPLPLLRRYGRKGGSFYFESGRRCASGEATLFLQSTAVDAIFTAVETQLSVFRAKAEQDEAAKGRAIAAVQLQKREEEARAEAERAAAIAKYKKEAERQVRLELEQERLAIEARKKEEAMAKRQQEEETEAQSSPARSIENTEARRSMIHRRNSAAAKRHEQAKQLTLSKSAEAQIEPKARTNAAALFGGDAAQEDEWGAGKSKIWKALNPKPLYYETAKDRRQRSEAVELGVVGGSRNFNAMRDMLSPDLSGAQNPPSESPRSATHPIMEEEEEEDRADDSGELEIENDEADDDDVAEQFTESVDPDAAVPGEDGGVAEEEGDDESEDGEVGDLDSGLLELLEKNRAQRAQEAEEHKRKLREEYQRQQRAKQEELDKELAVIAVKKKLEKEKLEREREEAVREAQQRIESELVFEFTFG